MLRRASALLVLAAAVGGCTNFQDPTTVVDLRMLAVVVQPSEIILDADLSNPSMPVVDPANNPPVMVAPLIVDPHGGGRKVTYTISACPNDPFAPAPPGGGQGGGAFPSGGARTTVGSALCDENDPTTWLLTPNPIEAGQSVRVTNEGGRLHTFTEVAAYGGGRVPPLRVGLIPAPECLAMAPSAELPPGATLTVDALAVGTHRFQCCIHSWMRAAIT